MTKLHEAIAVTYAAMGQELTDAALAIITKDLSEYPAEDVLTALTRSRKELRRITLADILDRIPGGRPGAEEAWAIVAPALSDESVTVVMTEEMTQALSIASNLDYDPVAARMAFKDAYARLVALAKENKTPVKWRASLGHDANGREGPLMAAVEKGLLLPVYVQGLLPYRDASTDERIRQLAGAAAKRLAVGHGG